MGGPSVARRTGRGRGREGAHGPVSGPGAADPLRSLSNPRRSLRTLARPWPTLAGP
ncbi:hypothetical protein PLANTIT3_50098 [Plantibacter sp. T3]|nr:hypothetical protein PLANTIT3_50098 [Plantibacter sp. T3]